MGSGILARRWAGKPAVISCVESLRVARRITAMDPFLVLLHSLSGSLSSSDLMELKFLCRERVGKRKLERMQSGLDLFSVLLEQNDLNRNHTGLLRELLASLRRHDLLQRLDNFEAGLAVSTAPGEAGGLGGGRRRGNGRGSLASTLASGCPLCAPTGGTLGHAHFSGERAGTTGIRRVSYLQCRG